MKKMNIIASSDLIRLRPDGQRDILKLKINEPFIDENAKHEALRYCCEASIEIFASKPTICKFFGNDSFKALQRAMSGIGDVVAALPFADELYASGFPNFGFPLDPLSVAKNGLHLTEKQSAILKITSGEKLNEGELAIVEKLKRMK